MSLSLFSPRSSLSLDLNNFIKHLKQREQTHLSLVQYIHKISLPNDSSVFLDQQLKEHRRFLFIVMEKQKENEEAEKIRNEKWEDAIKDYVIDTEAMKLINKSINRIMEILKGAVDRIKFYQGMYQFEYKVFRQQFLRYQIRIKLGDMVDMITNYSRAKLIDDIELFKAIIQAINNGQKDSIGGLIQQKYQKVRNKIQEEKNRLRRIRQEQIRVKKQIQREKEEEKIRIQEKMKILEERQRIVNKNKKRITKFVEGTLTKLYNPITEFSKAQYAEDMVYADYQQQYEKLLKEIMERNKFISMEISQFVSYGSRLEQKIKQSPKKQQRQYKSSPRLSLRKRISTSQQRPVSNNHTENNYSSIETIPELPPIRDTKTRATPVFDKDRSESQNQEPVMSTQTIIQKHVIFMKNSTLQKIQNPKKEILKPISIFDSVRFPDKRKELVPSQCLPYIKAFERSSLDTNKAKVVMHNKNVVKTSQITYKSYRRSETPQMLIPLIQIGVPDYIPLKGSDFNIQTSYARKRYVKD